MAFKAPLAILALLCFIGFASCETQAGGCAPGIPGVNGIPGLQGQTGPRGEKGDAGQKGDVAAAAAAANWKQCVWKNLNDETDNGRIRGCSFRKRQDATALKVTFQGNMRAHGDYKCNRWYLKFNGNECSGPATIDAVVFGDWPSGEPNIHRPGSLEGYCENLPRGLFNVELWVGPCSGNVLANAYTGWNSVSRIMVEEVPRSQN